MRTFRTTLVAVSVLLLGGCAVPNVVSPMLNSPATQAPTEQTSPGGGGSGAGQNSQKGDTFAKALGAGAFTPEEQGNPLFSPCDEITKEQWESLGWNLQHLPDNEGSNYSISCMLKSPETNDSYDMLMITTSNRKYDDILKNGKDLNGLQVDKPENVYVYDEFADSARDKECSAGVVTNRGRLAVTLRSYNGRSEASQSKEEVCQRTVNALYDMLNLPIEAQPTKKPTPKSTEKSAEQSAAERPTDAAPQSEQSRQSGTGRSGSADNA